MLPTNDVVTQIMSASANQAASMLLGMPAVQIRAVMNELGPAEVARVVVGAHPDRKADLLGIIGSDQMPAVLSRLTVHQLADVITVLPIDVAVRLARDMSPRAAADLLLEIPTQRRAALQEAMAPEPPGRVRRDGVPAAGGGVDPPHRDPGVLVGPGGGKPAERGVRPDGSGDDPVPAGAGVHRGRPSRGGPGGRLAAHRWHWWCSPTPPRRPASPC